MNLLKMPSGDHQCLIYATAMLLDVPVADIVEILGHNGMIVQWPDLPIPHCYRGVHTQEILDVCEHYGETLVCYQLMPMSSPAPMPEVVKQVYGAGYAVDRMQGHLESPGLILTDTHACAWDGKDVYDPNGRIISITETAIKEFWKLVRI